MRTKRMTFCTVKEIPLSGLSFRRMMILGNILTRATEFPRKPEASRAGLANPVSPFEQTAMRTSVSLLVFTHVSSYLRLARGISRAFRLQSTIGPYHERVSHRFLYAP
jgi:hypothetical protein